MSYACPDRRGRGGSQIDVQLDRDFNVVGHSVNEGVPERRVRLARRDRCERRGGRSRPPLRARIGSARQIYVDAGSFFAIVVVAAVAAVTVAVLPRRFAPPVVVVELILGIVVGPEVLDLARTDDFIDFFSNLGLGMLFFFAGYEIDFDRIKGTPLKLGVLGWLLSIALAYSIGGLLAAAGIVLSFLFTGSAMATTAIGTLIPILRDNGELKTRFGTYLLAAGGAGEFGPILLVTLVLSTKQPLHEAGILLAFVALALVLALASVRLAWRGWPALERTFEASSQLAVRITVVLVFGLVLLAGELGLDILLGGFVAGMIVRVALKGHELSVFESKLTAVGFGFFVPFFFITSGIEFDLAALGSVEALLKLAMFFCLFVIVRGTPAMLLYRARSQGPPTRRARLLLGDRAAAGRRDHHPGGRRRPHEDLDGSGTGRRGDALDPGLPLRRPRDPETGPRRR